MGLGHAQRDVAITGELRKIHPDLEMGSSPSRPAPKQQDSYQVRRWRSWYRWTILAMLAYAFLVVAAVTEHARHPSWSISTAVNRRQGSNRAGRLP